MLPLLNDYFRNDWRMADIVFGRNTTSGTGRLLTEISFDEVAEMANEVIDIADASSFEDREHPLARDRARGGAVTGAKIGYLNGSSNNILAARPR